ncbi:MAG: hypothetical protein Sylvanvirus18_20 [Sylvanvirus sp.]|uniref:Uncharacterized protein n=1 Tax=Sylvanvirus sp. TaxID=2487774 RepID=A0A3G5AIJ3_9VIRU|nr:MAG: hypothetical protein Sylvanvirus18_20 [Sylvanvirus sp.]
MGCSSVTVIGGHLGDLLGQVNCFFMEGPGFDSIIFSNIGIILGYTSMYVIRMLIEKIKYSKWTSLSMRIVWCVSMCLSFLSVFGSYSSEQSILSFLFFSIFALYSSVISKTQVEAWILNTCFKSCLIRPIRKTCIPSIGFIDRFTTHWCLGHFFVFSSFLSHRMSSTDSNSAINVIQFLFGEIWVISSLWLTHSTSTSDLFNEFIGFNDFNECNVSSRSESINKRGPETVQERIVEQGDEKQFPLLEDTEIVFNSSTIRSDNNSTPVRSSPFLILSIPRGSYFFHMKNLRVLPDNNIVHKWYPSCLCITVGRYILIFSSTYALTLISWFIWNMCAPVITCILFVNACFILHCHPWHQRIINLTLSNRNYQLSNIPTVELLWISGLMGLYLYIVALIFGEYLLSVYVFLLTIASCAYPILTQIGCDIFFRIHSEQEEEVTFYSTVDTLDTSVSRQPSYSIPHRFLWSLPPSFFPLQQAQLLPCLQHLTHQQFVSTYVLHDDHKRYDDDSDNRCLFHSESVR